MKKRNYINGLIVLLSLVAISAYAEEATGNDEELGQELKQNMGYFFGYSFGNMLKNGGNGDVDMESLQKGLEDSLKQQPPNLTREQQEAVISVIRKRQEELQAQRDKARKQAQAEQDKQAMGALKKANEFLAENAKKEGVKTTDSGLEYKILEQGDGPKPTKDSTVVVHYEGRLTDGTVFDSSKERGKPAEFALNQVIPGWTEGLQLMKEGGKARFFIPPDLGYGPGGTGGIPPNAVLIFDVELLKVK